MDRRVIRAIGVIRVIRLSGLLRLWVIRVNRDIRAIKVIAFLD
jgi:hypothetical protein